MVNRTELGAWLVDYISRRCKISPDLVAGDRPFNEFGMDSLMAVDITVEIEELFSISMPPTALLEFNTINLLLDYLGRAEQKQTT